MRFGIFLFIVLSLAACGNDKGGNENPVSNVELSSFSADYDRNTNKLRLGVGLSEIGTNGAMGEWFSVEGPLENGALLRSKFPGRRDASGTVSVEPAKEPGARVTCIAARCSRISLALNGHAHVLAHAVEVVVHRVERLEVDNNPALPFPTPQSLEDSFVQFLNAGPMLFNASVTETPKERFNFVTLHAEAGGEDGIRRILQLTTLENSDRLDLEYNADLSSLVIGRVVGQLKRPQLTQFRWEIAGRSLTALAE